MSKPKLQFSTDFIDNNLTPAIASNERQKLRKRLRRIETIQKKNERRSFAKINKFSNKYYEINEKPVYNKNQYIAEPEKKIHLFKPVKVYYAARPWLGETCGHTEIELWSNGYETIPEEVKERSFLTGYRPVKSYIKRWSDRRYKKTLKRMSSRAMRKNNQYDLPISRGGHKKMYDLYFNLY